MLRDVLAAVGYEACETGSYKVLIALAQAVGATEDVATLQQSMKEEMQMGDWLGEHLPSFVRRYLVQKAA